MSGDPIGDNRTQRVTQLRSAPHQAWVCGYAEIGRGCQTGPTSDGRCCRALTAVDAGANSAACVGDDEALSDDLPPCIPRRSHRFRRQSICVNLAILTGGILLFAMSLPSRERNFVPGELSSKHAQILENTLVSNRCSLCHPASHADNTLLAAFKGRFQLNAGQQDALCMQCHKGHMPAAAHRHPHDLTAEMWQTLASRKEISPPWRPVSTSAADKSEGFASLEQTSCATCHVEHHGRDFDLKKLADDSCQACHSRKFESLASGHPEFVNFPAERPRALAFSHSLHADKHFPQKSRDFDCRQCHTNESTLAGDEQISRSVSFEKACAACHNQTIQAATVDGWALLQLPSIDASAAQAGSKLEHWPAEARFGFEGVVSPVLRALLVGDADAQAALQQVPASGQLAEIDSRDTREQATRGLAQAVHALIVDTARDGQAAWRWRLETATRAHLGRELSDNEKQLIDAMCAGLPPDLFRKMESQWFHAEPQLASRATQEPSTHTTGTTAAPTTRSMLLVAAADDSLLLADSAAGETLLDDTGTHQPGDGLLSNESDSDEALLPSNQENSRGTAVDTSEQSQSRADRADHTARRALALKPLKGSVHVAAGGWYIDNQTMSLKYMPAGHADATLAAWSLWWSLMSTTASSNTAAEPTASKQLDTRHAMARLIPGGCVECHQLQSGASIRSSHDWTLISQWKMAPTAAGRKEFTKFSHTPHLSLPAVNDCRYCHVLPTPSTSSTDEPARLPRLVATLGDKQLSAHGSEFQKMRLDQCVACHRPNGANAGCLQCHNYHINALPLASKQPGLR